MFRRLMMAAMIVGIVSGLVFSIAQHFTVTPILLEAELFEQAPVMDMHHQASEWSPSNEFERSSYTFCANILAAIGFASLFLVVMSQLVLRKNIELSASDGAIAGLLAYAIFFVIPGLGLPPEIPGSSADLLENRQSWWLMAVVGGTIGVMVMVFSPLKYKALGLLSIAVPFIIGAPHYDGPMFNHSDPQAVASLEALHQQFLIATSMSNLIFWLVLGVSATLLLKNWIYRPAVANANND